MTKKKKIGIIGVGGGGMNTVLNIYDSIYKHTNRISTLEIDYFLLNTDAYDLAQKQRKEITNIELANEILRGDGTGADPKLGYKAAVFDKDKIDKMLKGKDIIFVSCGLGGGTGSGATPYIVERAKELGVVSVIFATFPWTFEGPKRKQNAYLSLVSSAKNADTIFLLDNDSMTKKEKGDNIKKQFEIIDNKFKRAIISLILVNIEKSLINIDFRDFINAFKRQEGEKYSNFSYFFDSRFDLTKFVNEHKKVTFSSVASGISREVLREIPKDINVKTSDSLLILFKASERNLSISLIKKIINSFKNEEINKQEEMSIIFGATLVSENKSFVASEIRVSGLFSGITVDEKFEVMKKVTKDLKEIYLEEEVKEETRVINK